MIRWAAGRPAVVWATGAALTLAGAVAFTKLPLATKTQVELPRLTVTADWFGSSPELVETYLTSPLEEAIQSVRGVKKISSESGPAYFAARPRRWLQTTSSTSDAGVGDIENLFAKMPQR